MAGDTRVRDAAKYYFNAHKSRASYGTLPEVAQPKSIEEAYAVQEAFQALLTEQGRDVIAGYCLRRDRDRRRERGLERFEILGTPFRR